MLELLITTQSVAADSRRRNEWASRKREPGLFVLSSFARKNKDFVLLGASQQCGWRTGRREGVARVSPLGYSRHTVLWIRRKPAFGCIKTDLRESGFY